VHLSLTRDGHNAFAGDEPVAEGVRGSRLFRHFLAGWIAHAPELMPFYAPTVNSYKRYQSASWAPTRLAWSHDNRTAGFRVVGSGPSLRIECRVPGAVLVTGLLFVIFGHTMSILSHTGAEAAAAWRARQRELKRASRERMDVKVLERWLPAAAGFGLAAPMLKAAKASGASDQVPIAWLSHLSDPSAALVVIMSATSSGAHAGASGGGMAAGGGSSSAR
jgi:hypothetical protein